MKKILVLFMAFVLLSILSIAQTGSIRNNLSCSVMVAVSYVDAANGCQSTGPPTVYPIPSFFTAGAVLNFALPGSTEFVVLNFWFPDCSVYDPLISDPGNCINYPDSDVMIGTGCHSCPKTGTITYLGTFDWEIN